jgi:hypothetical protein
MLTVLALGFDFMNRVPRCRERDRDFDLHPAGR